MNRHQTILESLFIGLGLSVVFIVLLNLSFKSDVKKTKSSTSSEFAASDASPNEPAPVEVLRSIDPAPNVTSAVQMEVGRELLCLLTVLYPEKTTNCVYKPDIPIRHSKAFFILFRSYVSPNAP